MGNSKEELKRAIEEKRKELEELEKLEKVYDRNLIVKELSEFTDEEKIKIFDYLYKSSLEDLETLEREGYQDEDSAQYVYEDFLEIVARDKKLYWKYRNSLT